MAKSGRSLTLSDIDSTPLSSTPDVNQLPSGVPPYSVIGVSISRAQTRLASPTTPAAEKAAAINDGGGYFTLPSTLEEHNESPPVSSDQSLPISQPDSLNEASPSAEKAHSNQSNKQQHRPRTIRKSSSTGSISLYRAMSTASSLGDDSRFENVRDQINNRFKAVKDSLQDSNFRLPSLPNVTLPSLPALPKLPNILNSKPKYEPDHSRRMTYDFSHSRPNSTNRARAISLSQDQRAGMKPAVAANHPYFMKALYQLTGDVVILGGYRGSHLRTTDSPSRRLWVPPFTATLNLTKVDLEVGLEDEDEERMADTIVPDGMLTHIGPIDVSRRLLKRLRMSKNALEGKLRIHEWSYDWRLSPHRLSNQFIAFLQSLPSNQSDVPAAERGAIVLAHSLGGIVTRHAVNCRPDLFAGVLYAGTPQHCVNILGPIRHGDDVLWSSKILTAQVNFTVRTSFALLPLEGKCFVDMESGAELPVDFFSVDDWVKYRFSPIIEPTLPALPDRKGIMDGFFDNFNMPNLPFIGRRASIKKPVETADEKAAETAGALSSMGNSTSHHPSLPFRRQPSVITPTIPKKAALAYLERTLHSVSTFKSQLAHNTAHASANLYPPMTVIYGKTEPTVCGARVHGYDGIARTDAYDNLIFASGDGVVLARAAMLPEGYRAAKGGVVGVDRGHIGLLGDLEGVGRCLVAMRRERRMGVGLGGSIDEVTSVTPK
jgi:pimeloyl-ACP methyl ester carboxylesterase